MDFTPRHRRAPVEKNLVSKALLGVPRTSSSRPSERRRAPRRIWIPQESAIERKREERLFGQCLLMILSFLAICCILQANCNLLEKLNVEDPEGNIYSEKMARNVEQMAGVQVDEAKKDGEHKIVCKAKKQKLWIPIPGRDAVFGGQLAAYLMRSAMKVDADADPHMITCSFIHKAEPNAGDMEYFVSDKRHVSSRFFGVNVTGKQGSKTCIEGGVKFVSKDHNELLAYDPAQGSELPDFGRDMLAVSEYYRRSYPAESEASRRIEGCSETIEDFEVKFGKEGHNIERVLAFRLREEVKQKKSFMDSKENRYALVAFISDLFLLETALAYNEWDIFTRDVEILSTEHTVHFHHMDYESFKISEPIYYRMRLRPSHRNLLLCDGEILQGEKTIATVLQKGVIKPRNTAPQSAK